MRSEFDRFAATTRGWKPVLVGNHENYRWQTPDGREHWFRVDAYGTPNERVVYSSPQAEKMYAEVMEEFQS